MGRIWTEITTILSTVPFFDHTQLPNVRQNKTRDVFFFFPVCSEQYRGQCKHCQPQMTEQKTTTMYT